MPQLKLPLHTCVVLKASGIAMACEEGLQVELLNPLLCIMYFVDVMPIKAPLKYYCI